ncbi:MAG: sensor histidine kinase [Actinomycetia bacterium]|nr:sensor histidine kinase [Actinomycetes bacterium]MCP4223320.1 sensor histidine kinase [Actinomycetes bacterium]MCP5030323.1 sensor histidine kinase [Actinomycetes bacterium]
MSPGPADATSTVRRLWSATKPSAERAQELSAGLNASLAAVLAALRWGAVMIGLAFATSWAGDGDIKVVVTLSVAIFITSWRTIVPIRFGEPGLLPLLKAMGDVTALAIAIGFSQGLSSPFVGSLFVAIAIAGFGWGMSVGIMSGVISVMLSPIPSIMLSEGLNYPGPLAVTALAGVAIVPGLVLDRLVDIEQRRKALAAQRDKLADTNQLLELLTDLARTLPSSLDLSDVLQATKEQLIETFDAHRIAIVSYEDGDWAPQFQDGFDLHPQVPTAELTPPLNLAAEASELLRVEDLATEYGRQGSGLYTRLVVAGVDIGLVAIEHEEPGNYESSHADILHGMSDVLALTLANARSFRRLRSLAAAEERSRIARDLHDRLGQYLTYIALELERINGDRDQSSPDLKQLHEDVQGAISEFRDTLIELRAAVTADRPLTVVLGEVVERFEKRSQVEVNLQVPSTSERLPAVVENEILRIAQEALVNVEKHSSASKVHLAWMITEGRGVLVVQDDGRGFDPSKGIRGSAYGLVGMRERAASVGAMLEISSQPGQGTTITVQTSQPSEQVKKP